MSLHKISKFLWMWIFVFVLCNQSLTQNNVYLLGNLYGSNLSSQLKNFEQTLERLDSNRTFTLVLLGDINQKDYEKDQQLSKFISKIEQSGSKVISVFGDHDWDDAKKFGVDTLSSVYKKYTKLIGEDIFLPIKDCPGPSIIDLNDSLRIIAINSQWWLHPYKKVGQSDSECKNILKVQILDELDKAIEFAGNRKVLLITHHPIITGGVHGGSNLLSAHLFPYRHTHPENNSFRPIYGTFYHYYRQGIGSKQDMHNQAYLNYSKDIHEILKDHRNVIVCSSHDYNLQVLQLNDNYQLVSGSFLDGLPVQKIENTMFKSKEVGFIRLRFITGLAKAEIFSQEKVTKRFVKTKVIPLKAVNKIESVNDLLEVKTKGVYPGDYGASSFKKLFFGKLYRDVWTKPIDVDALNIDSFNGGLIPLKKGGGRQTTSLKFIDSVGQKYVFRSINKKSKIPYDLRIRIVESIVQDMTAAQNPYGALFVSSLLDSTDIFHSNPSVYVMPNTRSLGQFRTEFNGMMGLFESVPTINIAKGIRYKESDKIKSTAGMLRDIYKSPKSSIDKHQFAKARVFDILIGDWDRHQDNWKWIGFKRDNKLIYKPFPKDRDHSFSKMNGIIFYLADREWAIPFRENFDYHFTGIRSLTLKGSPMDRLLLSSLGKKDWINAVKELKNEIQEETINNASLSLPIELRSSLGVELTGKLLSRREELEGAIEDYYKILAKEVDLVGTNKKDFFEIKRKVSGKVLVARYEDMHLKDTIYKREFYPDETKEIRIFGLGEKDSFLLTGKTKSSILVRIIGGDGNDYILDSSDVGGLRRMTQVYDYPNGVNVISLGETKTIESTKAIFNEYNQYRYKNNTYMPIPMILVSADDGFGVGLNLNFKKYGFSSEDYKTLRSISFSMTTQGSGLFSLSNSLNIPRSDFFFNSDVELGNGFPFYSFYGVGNSTQVNDSLREDGYYRVRYDGIKINVGPSYQFLGRSSASFFVRGELLENNIHSNSYFDLNESENLKARNLFGLGLKLDIDFRDMVGYTTKGIRFIGESTFFNSELGGFRNYRFEFDYYNSIRLLLPITLGVKVGSKQTKGENIPFYHLVSIGQSNYLRGYRQNRFSGQHTNYVNFDLRFHLGKIKSWFIPLYYGFSLFNDYGQVLEKDTYVAEKWHNGYGLGFFITPIDKKYITLAINFEKSLEEKALISFSIGLIP